MKTRMFLLGLLILVRPAQVDRLFAQDLAPPPPLEEVKDEFAELPLGGENSPTPAPAAPLTIEDRSGARSILMMDPKRNAVPRPEPTTEPKAEVKKVAPRSTVSLPSPTEPKRPLQDARSHEHADVRPQSGVATALPVVSLEVNGPPEVNVGKTARFTINVNNLGDSLARGVYVESNIPNNVKLVGTNPAGEQQNGRIVFQVGDLQPKEKQVVVLEVMPRSRGHIDLGTRVGFTAATRITCQVKQPELTISVSGAENATYGANLTFKLAIRNTGDGPAEDVVVSQILSDGLVSGKTPKNANQVGWIMPGESREVYLTAVANATGTLEAEFTATAAGGIEAKTRTQINVLKPMIEVDATGPSVTYLKRAGIYSVVLTNPGDAPATNVVVHVSVPHGLQLSAVDRPVQFDKNANMLRWKLDKLAPGANEVLRYKATAMREGELINEIVANGDAGLNTETKLTTEVISRADIAMQMADAPGPIEVGDAAEFKLVLKNRGTKAARNVTVRILLPETMDAIESGDYAAAQGAVEFPAITLPEGEEKTLRFQAIGRNSGDHTVKAVLQSETLAREVAIEENVFFYEARGKRIANKPER